MNNKRKIVSLTLTTLSEGESDTGGGVMFQVVIEPSNAECPKRTVFFDETDVDQLALEFEILALVLKSYRRPA